MIKLLRSSFLPVFVLIFNLGNSQTKIIVDHHSEEHHSHLSIDAGSFTVESNDLLKKDFSYEKTNLETKYPFLHQDHNHEESISLIDIISSDEGTDFNCSGGFCMNDLHFHKKGLTLKKQFFGYFMSISC